MEDGERRARLDEVSAPSFPGTGPLEAGRPDRVELLQGGDVLPHGGRHARLASLRTLLPRQDEAGGNGRDGYQTDTQRANTASRS
jgi:hypothetical protein